LDAVVRASFMDSTIFLPRLDYGIERSALSSSFVLRLWRAVFREDSIMHKPFRSFSCIAFGIAGVLPRSLMLRLAFAFAVSRAEVTPASTKAA